MTIQDWGTEEIAGKVMAFAKSAGIELSGPAYIEYGFGWPQTVSFWQGPQRMHLYWDFPKGDKALDELLSVEFADHSRSPMFLVRGRLEAYDDLWKLIRSFVNGDYASLSGLDWRQEGAHNDGHIPHPPDSASWGMGNIAAFVEEAKVSGKPWVPPDVEKVEPAPAEGFWKRLLRAFGRLPGM